jgi:hypothetical protein
VLYHDNGISVEAGIKLGNGKVCHMLVMASRITQLIICGRNGKISVASLSGGAYFFAFLFY